MRNKTSDTIKKSTDKINLRNVLLILILGICLVRCHENIEGCSDILASNYAFDRDHPCDSCCVYPQLNVVWEYRYGDTSLVFDHAKVDEMGNEFKILAFSYFTADAIILDLDSNLIQSSDTLSIQNSTKVDSTILKNDISYITKTNKLSSSKSIIHYGQNMSQIHLGFGLNECTARLDSTNFVSNTILDDLIETNYGGSGFDQGNFVFEIPIDTLLDTIRVHITSDFEQIPLTFNTDIQSPLGSNLQDTFVLDFEKLITKINLREEDEQTLATKIHSNISQAISKK